MVMANAREIMVSARKVVEEHLGDLKLYRVPEPTTVASRQRKQVRLLDRAAVPVERIYTAEIGPPSPPGYPHAGIILRHNNNTAPHPVQHLPPAPAAGFR